MTERTDGNTTRGLASLLFLVLGIALAVVIHVGFTEPAMGRLDERRAKRQELEERCNQSSAERRELQLRARALEYDSQTQERHIRTFGYGKVGESQLAPITGR